MSRARKFVVWWRRQGIGIRSVFTFALASLFVLLLYLQKPDDDVTAVGANLFVFLALNLVIVFLLILAFLVIRNVAKLIFDRKRNILGSKLRMRLVIAFVGLTLIPTVITYLLASGLLNSAMEGWFGTQTENLFNSAIEIARDYRGLLKEVTEADAGELERRLTTDSSTAANKEAFYEKFREERKLFSIQLINRKSEALLKVDSATAAIENFQEPEPDPDLIAKALNTAGIITVTEEKQASEFVRAYKAINQNNRKVVMVLSRRVDPELSHALTTVNESYREYEQVQLFRGPLKSFYLLTLAVITGLILFTAIWFGFYMAKELSVPIQRLAEGTKAVAKGNYDFRLKELGDDEMSFLIRSFNSMTADLKSSKEEAEKRRIYIETIVKNLAVGVISVDPQQRVISMNSSVAKLYDIASQSAALGKPLPEVLGDTAYQQLAPLLKQAIENPDSQNPGLREKELTIKSAGRELRILCTIGNVLDSQGALQACVLLFDNITELVKAQQMSVWREVARRIAHEIKNPLTPIQLSAQRLQKYYKDKIGDQSFVESTQTILENVDSIKRLANEFSNFARMPTAEFSDFDMNNLISTCIAPFAENHTDIVFQFVADTRLPLVTLDNEQIRRMVINLVDNAIGAFEPLADTRNEAKRIVIKTHYEQSKESLSIEVSDNGTGIPEGQKTRIFEPYYTTKSGGNGLGLAIVTSIVAEHNGQISVFDNTPHGARFVVELPLTAQNTTARKFA